MTLGDAKRMVEDDLKRATTSAAMLGKNIAFEKGYLVSKLAVAIMKLEELKLKLDQQNKVINELNELNN